MMGFKTPKQRKTVLERYAVPEEELDRTVARLLEEEGIDDIEAEYEKTLRNFEPGTVVSGRVVEVTDYDAIINVGYKSEGIVPIEHFGNPPQVEVGQEVEVFIESVEDEYGMMAINKRRADRIRAWDRILSTHKEGDTVRCRVLRKIKGGLLVDIGVPVFLPASQVGIRRAPDIAEYIGQEFDVKIIKIDRERMNIVVSRRRLEEAEREEKKRKLMAELEEGQLIKGVVKNITDFGAFVDLGGIDGLLHITDISWSRISHPSEVVAIGDEVEVKVLKIDRERERISLGFKQKTENPWVNVDKKYPIGARVKGRVVNILPYGAFVRLEDGVEGLVHISEMSWTKRINHPSELVQVGDEVETVILDIDKEKEEIALGMKQAQENPWLRVQEKYPPGTVIEGTIKSVTSYGAFIEIEEGVDGLLHVSDMSWTKRVSSPEEILQPGEVIRAKVLMVDVERCRISLGLKQLTEDPWERRIPEKYQRGTICTGRVTGVTTYGAFVELAPELEGLVHISEFTERGQNINQVLHEGDWVEVRVIRLDPIERRIGLSLRRILSDEDARRVAEAMGYDVSGALKEPAAEEPPAEPPAEEAPAAEPAAEEPAAEPAAEEPPAEPAAEEPPAAEESAAEPAAEEPPAEPAAEEPPAAEPASEEPPPAEPAAGEQTGSSPEG